MSVAATDQRGRGSLRPAPPPVSRLRRLTLCEQKSEAVRSSDQTAKRCEAETGGGRSAAPTSSTLPIRPGYVNLA